MTGYIFHDTVGGTIIVSANNELEARGLVQKHCHEPMPKYQGTVTEVVDEETGVAKL